MKIQKLEDGTLLVPKRIEENGIIGDSVLEVKLDHEDYKKYLGEFDREQELEKEIREPNKTMLR